jgi:hypothetical protein
MNHPAEEDYMETMKDANDAKKTLSDRLSVTKQLIENGMASTARHRSLQIDAVRVEAATQRLKKLQNWNFFYDCVFASSEYRIASTNDSFLVLFIH